MKSERLNQLLYIIAAAVSMAACSKQKYQCKSSAFSEMCTMNTDTVYFVTNGFSDLAQRTALYYETLGYSCAQVKTAVAGFTELKDITEERDVKILEQQGFICEEQIQ